MTLFHRFFDQPIMESQFRREYIKELVSLSLCKHSWKRLEAGDRDWDFAHVDGLHMKLVQSAACRAPTQGYAGGPHPAFYIGTAHNSRGHTRRYAGIYLFAWHPISEVRKVDHRDAEQWQFFVMPEGRLPPTKKTLGLRNVEQWAEAQGGGAVSYAELAGAVEGCRLRLRAEGAVQANDQTSFGLELTPMHTE
jgi:hypothetical protein